MYGIQIDNETTVSSLINTGTILGDTTATNKDTGYGIYAHTDGSIGTLTNSGTIKGRGRRNIGRGILTNNASLTSFTNSSTGIIEGITGDGIGGSINACCAEGVSLNGPTSNSMDIDNDGIIRGLSDAGGAWGMRNTQKIGTLDNSGTILGQADNSGARGADLDGSGSGYSISTINNSGTMSGVAGVSDAYGLVLQSRETETINNSGTINATATSQGSYGARIESIIV